MWDWGAFALAGPVAAGPFEYLLFRGDTSGGGDNWYLRSTLNETADPETSAPIPLYRPEVAVYSALPEMARQAALTTLGTFHERQGEQVLLRGAGFVPASWGRTFGQHTERELKGAVSPAFDGSMVGLQAGQDLWATESGAGHRDHLGLFVGYASTRGDVRGFAIGQHNAAAGKLDFEATSGGAYWTHIGPSDWYLDAVAMGTVFDGTARSDRGYTSDLDGRREQTFNGNLGLRYTW